MPANERIKVIHGDCLEVMAQMIADGILVDSVVCDPPYHLTSIVKRFGGANAAPAKQGTDGAYVRASRGFMGKQWDGGDVAFRVETWELALRLLKPGGHLIAFSGTRTYHRMACAIEDAGFEIRDQIGWLYGSGFPKSHDVSKGIDRASGNKRPAGDVKTNGRGAWNLKINNHGQGDTGVGHADGSKKIYVESLPGSEQSERWQGWGTALKPAWEPIVLARKPLSGTVAATVLEHGTGALNIDASRVAFLGTEDAAAAAAAAAAASGFAESRARGTAKQSLSIGKESRDGTNHYDPFAIKGRWPANVIHDGSAEVERAFPDSDGQAAPVSGREPSSRTNNTYGQFYGRPATQPRGDLGSAARFFYSAKADAGDRLESKHPTVKPVDLMAYLCRLITPPGGTILDPFAGSGTTGMAAMREGFDAILIEREAEYYNDILRRIAHVGGLDTPLFQHEPDPLAIPAFLKR